MEIAALAGTWSLKSAEMAGAAAPEVMALKTTVEIKAGHYCVRFDGVPVDEGTLELVDTAAGNMILRGTKGPNAGREIPALYRLDGAELEICYGFAGERPTEFRTQAGTPWYLAKYRRATT